VERVARALAPLAEVAAAAPGGVAILTDAFDNLAGRAVDGGVDLDARLASVLHAVEVSTSPRAVHGLATLVESKLLEPTALAAVSQFAAALAASGGAPPVGAWGALRDPDVQRALGFLLAVARSFGRQLADGELDSCRDHLLAASAAAGALEARP
jgi:hypothetical protein